VPLLRVGSRHQQREDMVKKWASPKLASVDGDLPQSRFPHLRIPILYFQQHCEYFSFLLLLDGQIIFVDILKKGGEEFILFRLDRREIA
jgi:hypothetical protein